MLASPRNIKPISVRKQNDIIASLIGWETSGGRKALRNLKNKDSIMNLQSSMHGVNNLDKVEKSAMLESIENGTLTWLDFYDDIAKIVQSDKLYKLPGISESNDFEKEEITKMRTFLFYFYRHGYWNTSATCDHIGISIMDVKRWSEVHFAFKDAVKAIINSRHDYAESRLMDHMKSPGMPGVTATIFYLRTMAGERGWREETTVNVNGSRSELSKDQIDKMTENYKKRSIQANRNVIDNRPVDDFGSSGNDIDIDAEKFSSKSGVAHGCMNSSGAAGGYKKTTEEEDLEAILNGEDATPPPVSENPDKENILASVKMPYQQSYSSPVNHTNRLNKTPAGSYASDAFGSVIEGDE